MDKITICDLEVFYRIGVPHAERVEPQRLLVTAVLEGSIARAAEADDIRETPNYFEVTERLKSLGSGKQWRLIETLATDIAKMILTEFPIDSVTVEVKKFIIPETKYVSVAISRDREWARGGELGVI